jgi:ABC-type sugar transport system substrate-binding protein
MALRMYEEQGDIKVVAAEWGYWDREKVASMMEAILAKEKVDGVVCSNDDMAMGAITAIKSAGLVPNRDVYVAGFDAIEEAVKAVREGTMALTITQAPYVEAYWSVLAAYLHLKKGWVPVTGYIPTPFFAVTKENVDTFSSQVLTPRMDLWSRYGPTIDQL